MFLTIFKKPYIFIPFFLFLFSCTGARQTGIDNIGIKNTNKLTARVNKRPSQTIIVDLLHTKLNLILDMKKEKLEGEAYLKLKPYSGRVDELIVDAKYMDIKNVSLVVGDHKRPLKYRYDSLQIKIELNKSYNNFEEFLLFIEYVVCPEMNKSKDKGVYFIKDKDSSSVCTQVWTQGETEYGSCWFPTIDQPNERCTQEVFLTYPDSLVSLSNGKLIYSSISPDGTKTDYWKQDLPHAPYLFMIAVGDFEITKQSWNGKPVWYYLEKEYSKYSLDIFGNTPQMLDFFSELLDYSYPWEKYSQVVVKDFISGAMENTSASIYFDGLNMTDRELIDGDYEDIIAHELFHHWFGNLVTCESWSHIALNESFATYGEYLWFEHKYGLTKAEELMLRNKESYLEESKFNQYSLVRHEYENKDDVFDVHSYEKGALILHYLRSYLGDEKFFKAIRKYLKANQYGSVETEHLRLSFENVSGEDLNWFFDQWFYSNGHPIIEWSYELKGRQAYVYLDQKTSSPEVSIFNLPLDLEVHVEDTSYLKRVWITSADTVYDLNENKEIQYINVDPFKVLPGVITERVENNSLTKQWKYLKSIYDKLKYLEKAEDLKESNSNIYYLALCENSMLLQLKALSHYLNSKNELKENEIERIKQLLDISESSKVRVNAAKVLLNTYSEKRQGFIYDLSKDSSILISNWSLIELSKFDSIQALKIARLKQNSLVFNEVFCASEVFSKFGFAEDVEFYEKALNKYNSWKRIKIMGDMLDYILVTKDRLVVDRLLEKVATLKWNNNSIYRSYIIPSLKEGLKNKYKKWYKGEEYSQKIARLEYL